MCLPRPTPPTKKIWCGEAEVNTNAHRRGSYDDYFSDNTDLDAQVYLMLANDLIRQLLPQAVIIAGTNLRHQDESVYKVLCHGCTRVLASAVARFRTQIIVNEDIVCTYTCVF